MRVIVHLCVFLFACPNPSTQQSLFNQTAVGLVEFPDDLMPFDTGGILLSHNFIQQVQLTKFLPLLQWVYIQHNLLTTLPDVRLAANSLKVLDVSYNRIEHIDPALLEPLVSLMQLNVWHNHLSTFPDISVPLPNLISLSLGSNRFSRIPGLGKLRESLSILSLTTSPKLKHIPGSDLLGFKSLKTLYLRDLDLLSLGSPCFLPALETLHLTASTLVCGPELGWLELVKHHSSVVIELTNVICSQPTELEGTPLTEVLDDGFFRGQGHNSKFTLR